MRGVERRRQHVIVIQQQQLVKAQHQACVFSARSVREFTCAIQLSAMNMTNKITYTNLIFVLLINSSYLMNNTRPFIRLRREYAAVVLIAHNLAASDSPITNVLYYYVLIINQQLLIFHDVSRFHSSCLFILYFSLHIYFHGLQTFVLLSD